MIKIGKPIFYLKRSIEGEMVIFTYVKDQNLATEFSNFETSSILLISNHDLIYVPLDQHNLNLKS